MVITIGAAPIPTKNGRRAEDRCPGPKWLLRKTMDMVRMVVLLLCLGYAGAPRATLMTNHRWHPSDPRYGLKSYPRYSPKSFADCMCLRRGGIGGRSSCCWLRSWLGRRSLATQANTCTSLDHGPTNPTCLEPSSSMPGLFSGGGPFHGNERFRVGPVLGLSSRFAPGEAEGPAAFPGDSLMVSGW